MKVMYVPRKGDDAETTAYGRRWKANVPVDIPETATYIISESVRTTRNDGVIVLTSHERKVSIIEMAKTNPTFQVGEEKKAEPKPLKVDDVRTPEEYRRYAMQWFKTVDDPEEFAQRWADEEDVRDIAGVSDADLRFLEPHRKGRLDEMNKRAREDRQARRMSA